MTPENAVLTSAMVTLGSTVGASIMPESMGGQGQLPSPKLLISTGLTFIGLSIITEMAPSIGVPLSACVALTALIWYGIPILDKYANAD